MLHIARSTDLITDMLNISKGDVILCIGYLDWLEGELAELNDAGYNAYGYELSGETKEGVRTIIPDAEDYYSWIFVRDLSLATLGEDVFGDMISKIVYLAQSGVFLVVPLVDASSGHYIDQSLDSYKRMQVRLTFEDWVRLLQDATTEFVVSGSVYHPDQKDQFGAYGYITLRRTLV